VNGEIATNYKGAAFGCRSPATSRDRFGRTHVMFGSLNRPGHYFLSYSYACFYLPVLVFLLLLLHAGAA
jgi:hypothetical protein